MRAPGGMSGISPDVPLGRQSVTFDRRRSECPNLCTVDRLGTRSRGQFDNQTTWPHLCLSSRSNSSAVAPSRTLQSGTQGRSRVGTGPDCVSRGDGTVRNGRYRCVIRRPKRAVCLSCHRRRPARTGPCGPWDNGIERETSGVGEALSSAGGKCWTARRDCPTL